MPDTTATPPDHEPVIRTIAMPADTNPAGDIFGGWLMAQMDLAAGNLAARIARGRSVTIAVDGMTFLKPVKVGDVVSIYADLESTGRSSMRIHVEAWRRHRYDTENIKVTDATFTFVAIDETGHSRPIPKEQVSQG
ncbi:MAG: acyl-CoA thioesterase [Rhodobacterales bacterium 65-51]|uniref:acyl-CoA thioesterase n=1 Tax=uncultured Gemmobacter sp. TaxID=1095917 RepID=UPI000959A36D|nr:acyl-CoA thioesterase [uncultured Gemmobacter sp.]OJY35169.1 MAG: acyl-CoA thioesterase [Rhodobacterales bacterium 65-51]